MIENLDRHLLRSNKQIVLGSFFLRSKEKANNIYWQVGDKSKNFIDTFSTNVSLNGQCKRVSVVK
jgi:hypothetical protein